MTSGTGIENWDTRTHTYHRISGSRGGSNAILSRNVSGTTMSPSFGRKRGGLSHAASSSLNGSSKGSPVTGLISLAKGE